MHRTLLMAAAIALLLPAAASAQTPRPKMDVAARVASVAFHGDTVEIAYVVENRTGSPLPLWIFGLFTEAPVVSLSAPDDAHGWTTERKHGSEGMPMWVAMADNLEAGQTSAPLLMRAVGLTDVVPWLAVPDLTLISDTEIDDEPHDQFRETGTPGTIVSVVPVPTTLTPAVQVERVTALLKRSCGADQWITDPATCASLGTKLGHAASAITAGDHAKARPDLESALAELDAQHGKEVTPAGYALLRPNVAFLLR